jgi:peptide/nickel transport system substrate-binding protein
MGRHGAGTIGLWGKANVGQQAAHVLCAGVLGVGLLFGGSAAAQKYGGVLRSVSFENPPSLSLHEETALSANWPIVPIYGNLIVFNPNKPVESNDDLVGELAESWAWSADGTRLTFKLRRGVTWHDGKPFSSADVKHTFDVARGASEKRFRLNPHKPWFSNIADIVTNGDFEVTFILKRPQPALIGLLASPFAPVIPAHIDPQELRSKAVGTGPFRLKELLPDQKIVLEKNPNFYVKGRPYLDGIEYYIIRSRPSRYAALQAHQIDAYMPLESTPQFRDSTKAMHPEMVVHVAAESISDNIIFNTKKPPFDNLKLRQAVNLALNRAEMIHSVLVGGGVAGGSMLPPPYAPWGLPPAETSKLPGYRDATSDRAEARRLLAEAGYGPGNPLKFVVSTRAFDTYMETATWVVSVLKNVGIEATLEPVETVAWYVRIAKRDFVMGVNRTASAASDPDAVLRENYSCGALRNYAEYCNPEVETLLDKVSMETDGKKRLQLAWEIDRRIQADVINPTLAHRLSYYMHWPQVKGMLPKNNSYNYGRFTDVWLDQ